MQGGDRNAASPGNSPTSVHHVLVGMAVVYFVFWYRSNDAVADLTVLYTTYPKIRVVNVFIICFSVTFLSSAFLIYWFGIRPVNKSISGLTKRLGFITLQNGQVNAKLKIYSDATSKVMVPCRLESLISKNQIDIAEQQHRKGTVYVRRRE